MALSQVDAGSAGASETLTISSTAVGFTESLRKDGSIDAKMAQFRVEGAPIRFTTDGTTPTSSVGTEAQVGDWVTVEGDSNVKSFRAIRATGVDATAYVTYSR